MDVAPYKPTSKITAGLGWGAGALVAMELSQQILPWFDLTPINWSVEALGVPLQVWLISFVNFAAGYVTTERRPT